MSQFVTTIWYSDIIDESSVLQIFCDLKWKYKRIPERMRPLLAIIRLIVFSSEFQQTTIQQFVGFDKIP